MTSVMLITQVFPPESAVGGHRPAGLCRHLAALGWNATVLSVQPQAEAALDPCLLQRIPASVRVVRAACPDLPAIASRIMDSISLRRRRDGSSPVAEGPVPASPQAPGGWRKVIDWLSWWFQVPDLAVGWFVPGVWAGLWQARRCRPDVLFSTGPAWTSHLIALTLSRLLRRPWVADFRDPWSANEFRKFPYPAHRKFNDWLESLAVRGAAGITCATDGIRRQLAARYPAKAQVMQTVLNGFDPEELDAASPMQFGTDRCVLLHAGTFYGPRSPMPLFEGLRRLFVEHPAVAHRLHVVLLGEPTYAGRRLEDMARDLDLGQVVRVLPRLPRGQAVAALKGADVAILFGQGGDPQFRPVPAKVYEYIGLGKPILAVGAGPESLDLIRRGGCRVWAVEDADPEGMAAALKEIVETHAHGGLNVATHGDMRLAFTRRRMAEALVSAMEQAMEDGRQR